METKLKLEDLVSALKKSNVVIQEPRPIRSIQDAILHAYNEYSRSTDYVVKTQKLEEMFALGLPYLSKPLHVKVEDILKEGKMPTVEAGYRLNVNRQPSVFLQIGRSKAVRSNIPEELFEPMLTHIYSEIHVKKYVALLPLLGDVIRDLKKAGMFPEIDVGLVSQSSIEKGYPK